MSFLKKLWNVQARTRQRDLYTIGKLGYNALELACAYNDMDTVELLLARGMNPLVSSSAQRSARQAVKINHSIKITRVCICLKYIYLSVGPSIITLLL